MGCLSFMTDERGVKAGAKAVGTKDVCGERVALATKEGVVTTSDNSIPRFVSNFRTF